MLTFAIKGMSGPAFIDKPRRAEYARTRSEDAEEQQAERVANRMVGTPNAAAWLRGSDLGKRLTPARPPITPNPASSPGEPLGTQIRAIMEPRFHWDFSAVRVHANEDAALSATALHAQAYTLGRHIVLGAGHPALSTDAGRRLIAHELTHVVQQATSGHAKLAFKPPAAGTLPALGTTSTWSGGAPPADMIIAGGTVVPEIRGNVEAAPKKDDPTSIVVTAPDIMMPEVPVRLDDAKYQIGPGKSVQVGFIQTVSSARLTARYEAPGEKPGDPPVVFEEDLATPGPRRDVALGHYKVGDPIFAPSREPWYLPPVLISPVHTSATVKAEVNGVPNLFDKPSFEFSKTTGKGTLTGFGGADTFQTSVAAKDSNGPPTEVTHLLKSTWTVPWDVTVNPAMTGHGKEVTKALSRQAPSALIGPTAAQSAERYLDFPTLAAAMAVEPAHLLINLAATKAVGQTASYANTVAALKAKNPEFEATVTCVKTDAWFGSDNVRFHVGTIKAEANTKLNDGQSASVTFHLNDLVDTSKPLEDTEAHLWVDLGSGHDPQGWWWMLSEGVLAPSTQNVGGGEYTVQGKLR